MDDFEEAWSAMQVAGGSRPAAHPAAKVQPQRNEIPAHRPRVSSGAAARQAGWASQCRQDWSAPAVAQ